MIEFKKTLFIFRRDLRLEDNTGLLFALEKSERVIPCFIFTSEQVERNPYKGEACLQFMIESLEELDAALKRRGGRLYLFRGSVEEVVKRCLTQLGIDGVVVNRDYTPYSVQRDRKLKRVCQQENVPFYSFEDALLHAPEETCKEDGTPYTVFTPFYRHALPLEVLPPRLNSFRKYFAGSIPFAQDRSLFQRILPKRRVQQKGGRKAALVLLRKVARWARYQKEKDYPALLATTRLSAHLKFTTCSPREVYQIIRQHFGADAELIRSLFWRDFFSSVALHFPHVFKGAFRSKGDSIRWCRSRLLFKKWCRGQTGFPLVDAGMRELNQTGYLSNRLRMVVASFLVKDLHLDWRWGERYFAQQLIDYDPAVNNGNWQWVAGTGCDAQPYFRVLNPWSQQKKFDPDCVYIRRWVPELTSYSPAQIHRWYQEGKGTSSYPRSIVDHAKEAALAVRMFRH